MEMVIVGRGSLCSPTGLWKTPNHMNVAQIISNIQTALLIPQALQAPRIGPLTRGQFEHLAQLAPDADYTWSDPNAQPIVVCPPSGRLIIPLARQLVEAFEGCQLKAYQDEVGVWTIGYGHTGLQHKDGTVYAGRMITQSQADQLLDYDMNQFEHKVQAVVTWPIDDDQFGALVAFDFNTGGLADSTLLHLLNTGNIADAANQFLLWNHAGGQVLAGLTRRRNAERALFLSDLEDVHKYMQA